MALEKTLTGKGDGNTDIKYHMIPNGTVTKNLETGEYIFSFTQLSFKDKATRDSNLGHLSFEDYSISVTEADIAGLVGKAYDHIVSTNTDLSDATEI